VLGRGSGDAFSIDVDVLDELLSFDIRRLAEDILGPTPLRRVGNAPKVALFFRWAAPEEAQAQLSLGLRQLAAVFDDAESAAAIAGAQAHVAEGRFYPALRAVRTLLPREAALLGGPTAPPGAPPETAEARP